MTDRPLVDVNGREWPSDPDPYHFAKMLDEELHRVQLGVASPKSIERARQTWKDGAAAIAAGDYAGAHQQHE